MILLDATVVIDHIRGKDPKVSAVQTVTPLLTCGVTRSETLAGARNPAHRQNLLTALATFPDLPFPNGFWDTVGDHLAALSAAGVVVPFPDVVVCTLGVVENIPVWAKDKHFPFIQRVLPTLVLYTPP